TAKIITVSSITAANISTAKGIATSAFQLLTRCARSVPAAVMAINRPERIRHASSTVHQTTTCMILARCKTIKIPAARSGMAAQRDNNEVTKSGLYHIRGPHPYAYPGPVLDGWHHRHHVPRR